MHIVVASDQWFPDLAGGSARVAAETAHRLALRGHHVTVLAPRKEGEQADSTEGTLRLLRVLPRTVVPQTLSDVVATARHGRRARPSRVDLLVAHQSTTAVGLSRAGLGAPLVLVYHASAAREARFLRSQLPLGLRRAATSLLEPALSLLEGRAVSLAAGILILSEFSRSLLRSDHPEVADRAVRVPGAVDAETFSPGDGPEAARRRLGVEPDAKLILTVRRLVPRMGIEQLLHALVPLLAREPLRLVIVGWGPLERSLHQLSARLGVEQQVHFAGRVPEAELPDWYRAADLFVLPTIAYEGFGIVTAEALACGTPVVGTPVGATPELLRPLEPRLLARGTDPDLLAAAIADGLSLATPAFRERCREYASQRFSWDRAIVAWEDALVAAAR
jgi:glycosyltransferase involved in cell wall biosynthesis